MQRAYRGGTFKTWMNNDTRVKARGQLGLLHCPRQPGCASVDSGKAAGRRKISVSYSSAGVAARRVNGPTLGSVAISLQRCHRMGKEEETQWTLVGSGLWKADISACSGPQAEEKLGWMSAAHWSFQSCLSWWCFQRNYSAVLRAEDARRHQGQQTQEDYRCKNDSVISRKH